MNIIESVVTFLIKRRVMAGLLFVSLAILSCTPEIRPIQKEGEVQLKFTLNIPSGTLPGYPGTKALAEPESTISGINILVLEYDSEQQIYRYSYQPKGVSVSQYTGDGATVTATFSVTENPVKLFVLANASDIVLNFNPTIGTSESEIRSGLVIPTNVKPPISMFGEISLDAIPADLSSELSLSLLRSLARVDFSVDLEESSKNFRIKLLASVGANSHIQIIPDETISSSYPKVSNPSIPSSSSTNKNYAAISDSPEGSLEMKGELYMPESQKASDPSMHATGITRIVLGGFFDEDTEMTYYRIDFKSINDGRVELGQILRNHKYEFIIKKVLSRGWPTFNEAALSVDQNIEVEIREWESYVEEIYFSNEGYFGLNKRFPVLSGMENSVTDVLIQSNVNYTIEWLNQNGTPSDVKTNEYDQEITDPQGKVKVKKQIVTEDGKTDMSRLVFTALTSNRTNSDRSVKLRIHADYWQIDLTIVQNSRYKHVDKVISIMAFNNKGGVNDVAGTSGGKALRQILENRFNANDTIPIKGFLYKTISQTEHSTTPTQTTWNLRTKELWNTDVLFLGYDAIQSAQFSAEILRWLDASDRRVLVISFESLSSSINIKNLLTDDGDWHLNTSSTFSISDKWIRAKIDLTEKDSVFFDGPFGKVGSSPFSLADATFSYNLGWHSPSANVTPLAVSNKSGYVDCMILGVNRERRIVYMGDTQLTTIGSLSNETGKILTDYDRLMANLWAWIVSVVVGEAQ